MKKIFLLFLSVLFLCSSCTNKKVDIESNIGITTESTEKINSETTPEETILYNPNDFPNDPFQAFDPFGGGYGIFFGKVSVFEVILPENPIFIRFRVLSVLEDHDGMAKYQVQVTQIYGSNMAFDKERAYVMNFRGSSDTPRYGRPMLEVGEEYVRFASENFESRNLMQASLIFKVSDIDSETYIYGYGVDFSETKCAEKITNDSENAIYEIGKHDKILTYLKFIGEDIPVFEYKCEINALLAEVRKQ